MQALIVNENLQVILIGLSGPLIFFLAIMFLAFLVNLFSTQDNIDLVDYRSDRGSGTPYSGLSRLLPVSLRPMVTQMNRTSVPQLAGHDHVPYWMIDPRLAAVAPLPMLPLPPEDAEDIGQVDQPVDYYEEIVCEEASDEIRAEIFNAVHGMEEVEMRELNEEELYEMRGLVNALPIVIIE